MKRFWSLILMFGGVLIVVGGFFYQISSGGCLLAMAGFSSAASFSGRPELADSVRIAHGATMLGWLGAFFLLSGLVFGVVRLAIRKPSRNPGKSQDQSGVSP